MESKRLSFSFTAKSPITHGEFSDGVDTGNIMLFRRLPVVGKDGSIYSIPAVSGNALRGAMRRLLTRELFDALYFRHDKLYLALANGGALEKTLDQYIRPEKVRETRALLPILSAFGSALYTYMLPGVLNMGFAMLQCSELGTGDKLSSELVADVGMTRHLDRTEADTGDAKPMPYVVETVIPGARFDCEFAFLDSATDIDKATVFHGLNLLRSVGGKAASGFGFIELSERFDDTAYLAYLDGIDDDYREKVQIFAGEL